MVEIIHRTGVEGKKLTLSVDAHNGIEQISSGTHERYIIDRKMFDSRIDVKKQTA